MPSKRPADRDGGNKSKHRRRAAPVQSAATNTSEITRVDAVPSPKKLLICVCGDGSAGELGLGPTKSTDVKRFRLNPHLENIVNIAAGGMHAAAITADNQLLTWGQNDDSALGRDTTWDGGLGDIAQEASDDDDDEQDLNPREATPTAVSMDAFPPDTRFIQVVAGDCTTFVLTNLGHVYGCGTFRNESGKWAFSLPAHAREPIVEQRVFTRVAWLEKIITLSAGADFALALDADGKVFAWGSGPQNQLGRRVVSRRILQSLIPARVELPKKRRFVSIHAAADHAFAIDSDGDTYAWGLNNFAQTGITDAIGQEQATVPAPKKVAALPSMQMIAGGRHHSIGLTHEGECLVWGRMDGGQMGLNVKEVPTDDPTTVMKDDRGHPRVLLKPTLVPIGKCSHVAAGTDHSLAITTSGKAFSWGFNASYQCGQGTDEDIPVATIADSKAIRDLDCCWAGAGGQYSVLAANAKASPRPDSL